MTRKDIEQLNVVEPYCFESNREEQWYDIGLKHGLEIADNNPKSSWISIGEDLPCNHEELWIMTGSLIHTKKVLIALIDDTIRLLSMLYDEVNNKWKWESNLKDKIIFWAPTPELPKE